MATFSSKGNKKLQVESAKTSDQATELDRQKLSSSSKDDLQRFEHSQLMQRDAARLTEKKIDAIEAAIAKDYLKASVPVSSVDMRLLEENTHIEPENTPGLHDFPPTIFRFDKESILFTDDDDVAE